MSVSGLQAQNTKCTILTKKTKINLDFGRFCIIFVVEFGVNGVVERGSRYCISRGFCVPLRGGTNLYYVVCISNVMCISTENHG